ncbi:hypothetical protein CRM22_011311 [Opisthorchis felineus]|uniref:Uncharacterized protein n=1 Tax=Opisthorchis felineus TaxID=147828 RepID=A0A4S2JTJ0_OPIFE|nr:hypothetical protein CRM22_011311 [Opisthorchis felineus]
MNPRFWGKNTVRGDGTDICARRQKEGGSKIGYREFCDFMNEFGEDEVEKRNKLRGILRTWELNRNSPSARAELHQALLDCGIEVSCDKVSKIIAELDADQSTRNGYKDLIDLLLS